MCTGEHCVHWNLKSPGPAGYQGVHRGTLHALDDKQGPNPAPPRVPSPSPQGPHPTNFETQLNKQTRNQIQFFPRVPTLPNLNLKLENNLNF